MADTGSKKDGKNDSSSAASADVVMATSQRNLVITACVSFGFTQFLAWMMTCDTGMLHTVAGAAIGIQLFVYLHASGIVFGNQMTEKYYDLTGSCTYITLVLLSAYSCPTPLTLRQKLLTGLVVVWAARLGSFLFSRIVAAGGEDSRFIRLRRNRYRFAIPWIIQGVWVFLTALPVFIVHANKHNEHENTNNTPSSENALLVLTVTDKIGLALWVLGFVFEVMADHQKSVFKKDEKNKDRFISTGLWALSRHPNCTL
jgi:steroid 5-alpha reductase family enzyme